MMMTATRTWTPEEITRSLLKSRRFVERAALALYNRQTPAQRHGEDTGDTDGLGYNRWDKRFMGSLCDQMLASTAPEGHRLTDAQIRHAVITLRRYAKQLADIATRNEVLEAEVARRGAQIGPCPECHDTRVVVTMFLNEPITEPCPRCGDTPYREG